MAKEGRNFNDRELASQVRSLCLNEIKAVFEYEPRELIEDESELQPDEIHTMEHINTLFQDENKEMADMKKQLILKMSTSILPRLNELSGPDGGEIPLPIYGGKSKE